LSTIYSIGLHQLPPYLTRFMKDFPSVNVRVEYRRSNLVHDDIIHNSVDLGLVAYPARMRQLEVIPFQEDRLVLICHPDHALARRPNVEIQDVANEKFVAFDQDIPTRKATDQILKEHKIEIDPVMEFDNIETVKRAVEIGAGIAIIPQATVQQEVRQGVLKSIHLRGNEFTRPLAIVHRRGRVLTPAMKKFIASLTGKPYEEEDSSETAA
jgi:DNA-binding transcriptional LysR family regulator